MQGERHPNGTSRTISTRSRIRSAAACSKGVVTSNLEPGANIGTQVSSPSGMFAPNYKTPRALQMTGVGFGYAPMLSSLKATSPAPANSRSPNTTIARRLRQNAMRGLNITCPAAIVTVDEHGFIELANVAAVELMAPRDKHLIGQPIAAFLPELHHALRWEEGPQFRTSMQCRAHRGNGESFLADVWFSSYKEGPSPKLAAIIADVTESTSAGSIDRERISLSGRESDVLRLLVQGLANKEIASQLNISESVVKNTLQQLFSKTEVRTRSQLVRVALERYRDML